MILTDTCIKKEIELGRLVVTPYDEGLVQAASLDIRIGDCYNTALPGATNPIITTDGDSVDNDLHYHRVVADGINHPDYFHVYPDQFDLAPSLEYFEIPNNIAAKIEGKTSLARLGLLVCPTAGFVAPGYKGHLAIELFNLTNRPIKLTPKMPIAQLVFFRTEEPCEAPYASGTSNETSRELKRLGLI